MLRIHLFGNLRVLHDGVAVKFAAPPKTVPLWAYLLLHRGDPIPRQVLAYTLWPDDSESDAKANLRRHLHQLQRALPPAPSGRPWVLSSTETMQWNPTADHWLDVADFERLCASEATWSDAVSLYTGDLLETVYEDWMFYERERLRDLYFAALTSLVLQHRAQRDYPTAIHFAQQLLGRDPLREDAMRQLMALRYEAGDRAGALKDYERFARRLREELAVDPMPETAATYEAIVRQTRLSDATPEMTIAPTPERKPAQPLAPLVGREAEMEQLRAWWSRAARGRGGVVLLGGEAGVGKTRLASELKWLAETQGARTLIAGTTFAEPLPYQAVAEAFRSALPLFAALQLDPIWLAAVARLIPDLDSHLAQKSRALPALPPLDPDRERQRLFEALARCLEGLAHPRPVLLILEDLHWAGLATMALIEFLARRVSHQSVLILITYREEEAPRAHPLRDLRRRLQREGLVSHLTLGRLSAPAITELVAHASGLGSGAEALASRLYAESEGNPFFLGELMRDWLEAGQDTAEPGGQPLHVAAAAVRGDTPAPPGGVQAVIAGRLARLTPQAQSLAEVAAVVGPAFDVELVREVSGWDESQTLDALEELLDRQLVREAGGRSRSDYTFAHHLIQAAIYAETPKASRARRHRRVAQVMEELYPDRQDELCGYLAIHFDRGGIAAPAADYYLRAARSSLAVYADDEALAHLSRTLELASDAHARLRFDALALREPIYHRRGLRQEQRADLEQLDQLAHTLADEHLICESLRRQIIFQRTLGEREAETALIAALKARAAASGDRRWQAEALQTEAVGLALLSQFDHARVVAQQALAAHQSLDDTHGQLECVCLLAEVAARQMRLDEVQSFLAQANALSESLADLSLQARALKAAYVAAHEQNKFPIGLDVARQLLDLCQTIGDREGEADAYSYLGTASMNLFHVQESRDYFAKAEALFEALGIRQGQAAVLINSGVSAIRLGHHAEGIELCRKAEAIFEFLKEPRGQMLCALNISAAAFGLGDYALAKEVATRNLELAQAIKVPTSEAFAFANLGRAERELGEFDQAIEHMKAGLEIRRRLNETDLHCTNMSDLVIAYLRVGNLEAARQAAEEMLTLYDVCAERLREPQRPLWAAAQAYRALGDEARAAELLAQAHTSLQAKAAAIPDPESQVAFRQIPYNREMLAAHERGEWPASVPRR
ncbi:MAG TPA: AAA family ATPase [Anaerolineales bacterium]|nr:AAA family ATPase [Anaerolineales bacterium]